MIQSALDIVLPFIEEEIIPKKLSSLHAETDVLQETIKFQTTTSFLTKREELEATTQGTWVGEEFTERTQSMVATLSKVHTHVMGNGLTFLIAGAAHLNENSVKKLPHNHTKLSLKPLLEFLTLHGKENVILEPKELAQK